MTKRKLVLLIAVVIILLIRTVPKHFIETTLGTDEPLLQDVSEEEASKGKETNSFSLPYTEVEGVLTFKRG